MKSAIRTLVYSDDDLSREGILRLLDKTRYKAAPAKGDLDALLNVDGRNALVILVLGTNACIPAPKLRALAQRCKIVLIADQCDGGACYDALCAGAAAYVPRTISSEGLLDTLDMALEGEVVLPSILVEEVLHCSEEQPAASPPLGETVDATEVSAKLSPREIEIIRRLVHGASNKRISRDLNIMETTVKAHVKAILRKLGATNRTQVAIWGSTYLPAPSQTTAEAPQALATPHPAEAMPAQRRFAHGNERQPTSDDLTSLQVMAAATRPRRARR